MSATVLVVDDEPSFTEALSVGLRREGFQVRVAADGTAALREVQSSAPDMVLLDVMLPGMSGVDVCREIRKSSQVPLIMVTARGEEIDAVVGLEVGADDYIAKPYRLHELIARMRAVLRRVSAAPKSDAVSSSCYAQGNVRLDVDSHELRVGGQLVPLALKEFELLAYLMRNAGRVVTRDSLMTNVWGYDYLGESKTIDVHVKRLRAKIEPDPQHPQLITTIRGLGYRYERSPRD